MSDSIHVLEGGEILGEMALRVRDKRGRVLHVARGKWKGGRCVVYLPEDLDLPEGARFEWVPSRVLE